MGNSSVHQIWLSHDLRTSHELGVTVSDEQVSPANFFCKLPPVTAVSRRGTRSPCGLTLRCFLPGTFANAQPKPPTSSPIGTTNTSTTNNKSITTLRPQHRSRLATELKLFIAITVAIRVPISVLTSSGGESSFVNCNTTTEQHTEVGSSLLTFWSPLLRSIEGETH